MKNFQSFINCCQESIADQKAGRINILAAAALISTQAADEQLEADTHPMLYKIEHLAFDIAEDYRSDADNEADWEIILKTFKNYMSGTWEPTCWILNASYGQFSGEKLSQSYSLFARRQNGENNVEVAVKQIHTAIEKAIKPINAEQTDERYLKNLQLSLPTKIGKYTLLGSEVHEYLTEPYYTTA